LLDALYLQVSFMQSHITFVKQRRHYILLRLSR